MRILYLEISQHDCYLCQLTKIYPNITLIVPYIETRLNEPVESGYIYVSNIDSLEQSHFIINYLRSHCLDVDIILKSKDQVLLGYKMKETSFWRFVRESASKVIFPIIAKMGVENWLIVTEKSSLKHENKLKQSEVSPSMLEGLHHINEIYSLTKLLKSLTPAERNLIKRAYFGGYFEYPRRITIKDIARDYGVSPNTIAKRLKNIEKKVFSWLVSVM